jgi:hypothetical protein
MSLLALPRWISRRRFMCLCSRGIELRLRYTHEQGIAHRLAAPEEIFPPGIMAPVKI